MHQGKACRQYAARQLSNQIDFIITIGAMNVFRMTAVSQQWMLWPC